VVVQDQTEMFLNLNHHPVCAASDASHSLLTGAATPPSQELLSKLDRIFLTRVSVSWGI
jgi:hypothetical protein